jgi:hypothetical protein
VKARGRGTRTRSSAIATASQQSRSGQYPDEWLLISVTLHPLASRGEGDLAGRQYLVALGRGDVLAATGREPEQTGEVDHERERFEHLGTVAGGQPRLERRPGPDDHHVRGRRPAQRGVADVPESSRARHAGRLQGRSGLESGEGGELGERPVAEERPGRGRLLRQPASRVCRTSTVTPG